MQRTPDKFRDCNFTEAKAGASHGGRNSPTILVGWSVVLNRTCRLLPCAGRTAHGLVAQWLQSRTELRAPRPRLRPPGSTTPTRE